MGTGKLFFVACRVVKIPKVASTENLQAWAEAGFGFASSRCSNVGRFTGFSS